MGGANGVLNGRAKDLNGDISASVPMESVETRNANITPSLGTVGHIRGCYGGGHLHKVARREVLPCCHEYDADEDTA